jgi:superfamily II DNA or RNA helicase
MAVSSSPTSTARSPTRSTSRPTSAPPWPGSPAIAAESLALVREPAAWLARAAPRRALADLAPALRLGLAGVEPEPWNPPGWLLPHQRAAARRLAASLRVFGGALLADAVGLGKSFVALALAGRHRATTLVIPAALRAQWRELAATHGSTPRIVTHEALSRGARVPPGDLLVVDEAHRFKDPRTRRYDVLARQVGRARLLLLTATPVVNRAADLTALLRLFLSDHALAPFGVPSLERAGAAGDADALALAVAPLVVARSPDSARPAMPIPHLRPARVIRAPPVEPASLRRIVRAIRALRFVSFGPDAAALLRRHLLGRLASSPEAARETVRRHRRYLERAREAARRGERLGRSAARRLFGADDYGQLDLLAGQGTTGSSAPRAIEREMDRLAMVEALLDGVTTCPKLEACLTLLRRRRGRKTIVFTAARATARALATALAWRRVAVVAGRRAEIASGAVPVAHAFQLFAPLAQGHAPPGPVLRLDTLIATDVAALGLNLQDADGVAHYDLPWTPLALEQRVGRARRLGSTHRRVRVWWFAPPALLERRLGISALIAAKATLQTALATPLSSAVGRVAIPGGALDRREALLHGETAAVSGHAVIEGDPAGPLAVVRLRGRGGEAFHLVTPGQPGVPCDLVATALGAVDAPAVPTPDLAWLRRRLQALIAAADAAPSHPAARHLARRIASLARVAARARDSRLLTCLDQALQLVVAGLAVGAERELTDLTSRPDAAQLSGWCSRSTCRDPALRDPDVVAVVSPMAADSVSGYIRVHGHSGSGRAVGSSLSTH